MRLQTMMRALLAAAACFSSVRAEEAPKLKVPPVTDRPVAGQKSATQAKDEVIPASSPGVPPRPAPGGGAKPDEKETAASGEKSSTDGIAPEPFPLSRYEALWENSPFQIESIAPPTQSEGLAQRFVLGGILRENGEPVIWVRERATQQSYKVSRNTTNNVGLSLVEVDESMRKQSEATATIRLGNEQGVIKFDAASVASVPGAGIAPPMARPAMPTTVRPPQPGVIAPVPGQAVSGQTKAVAAVQAGAGIPAVSQPGVVPSVPGPAVPANGQMQTPGQGQMPPPRVIRRRAIVPAAPSTP